MISLMNLTQTTAFENLTTTIQQTIDLVDPEDVVTISAKIDSLNHGLTKGLIKSS